MNRNAALMILGLVFSFVPLSSTSPLEEELAKLRQAGIPASIEELNLSDIPDKENGALVYREVFKMIDDLHKQHKEEWEYIPYQGNIKWEVVPEAQQKKVTDLVLYDSGFMEMYRLATKAIDMKCRFYPKDDYFDYLTINESLLPKILPDMTSFRNLERLLMAKAKLEAEIGETDKSLQTILTGLKIARAPCSDVPLMTSQLVRIAMDTLALEELRNTNEKGLGDAASYRALVNEMRKSREESLIYSALKFEVFFVIQMYDWLKADMGGKLAKLNEEEKKKAIEKMKKERPDITEDYIKSIIENPEKLVSNQRLAHLRTMRQVLSILKTPYQKFVEDMKNIEVELKKAPSSETAMPLMLLPTISRAYLQECKDKACLGAAEIGLANRIYRQQHGAFADSLKQLTPDILPALPLDPFTGKDYIYKKTAKGFIVYSVADNLKDDGGVWGKPSKWQGDFDIVWEDTGLK